MVTLFILVVGIALGIVGILKGKDYIKPYIPSLKPSKVTPVQGIVVKKMTEGSKLLMTVDTSEGALLATFTNKVNEIDLLVSEGDMLEFSLVKYAPFITDPVIHRVRKDRSLSTLPQQKEVMEEQKEQQVKKETETAKPAPAHDKREDTQKPEQQSDEGTTTPAPPQQEQKEEPAAQ